MVPSGQPLPSPFLNSNSAILGGEKGNNLSSMNFLGSMPNISSILGPSFGSSLSPSLCPSTDHDPLSDIGFCSNQPQNYQQFDSQSFPQQLSMASVKHDPPPPSKTEQNDQQQQQSMYLQQHQQQQQFLQISRQSSQAAAHMNLLQQQRILQMQQQQMKAIPLQRGQQQQPLRVKAVPEVGTCSRRLTQYMYEQRQRPEDNNIEFWRKFVANYFTPNAKKKWCVSMYGSGRHTNGVFPQDVWHCEICNCKPGRGFEATAEVLPRLFKIKYESGTLEELLYVDMPCENTIVTGQIVLDYAKAIQESVFEQLRVVREGQLRIVFSPDLKICSWEFCARRHEELIPRRLLIPQVSQLGAAAQKYQAAAQSAASTLSLPQLQNNCNMFVASARQLAKALDVPLVNDLGYTKRYVRCLQISEVVNSMKDLIDYSRDTSTGPMDSLSKFPKRMRMSTTEEAPPNTEANIKAFHHHSPNNGMINTRTPSPGAALLHLTSTSSRPLNTNTTPYFYANGATGQQHQQQQQQQQQTSIVDGESSVEKIIHEMMMARQVKGCVRMGSGQVGRDHVETVNGFSGINFDWKQQ